MLTAIQDGLGKRWIYVLKSVLLNEQCLRVRNYYKVKLLRRSHD